MEGIQKHYSNMLEKLKDSQSPLKNTVNNDNKKADLLEWAAFNLAGLQKNILIATGTTGQMLQRELQLAVTCLRSGPLGGDMQIGARIADGAVDMLVFFWDPLEPQPHDPDVKALLRMAGKSGRHTPCRRRQLAHLRQNWQAQSQSCPPIVRIAQAAASAGRRRRQDRLHARADAATTKTPGGKRKHVSRGHRKQPARPCQPP